MLDIINQQGAQVVALQQAIQERNLIIKALALDARFTVFSKQQLTAIDEAITGVRWKMSRNGTLTITVKRKKDGTDV